MEDCLSENGIQKQFVLNAQQCVLKKQNATVSPTPLPSTTTTKLNRSSSVRRHPMYNRYGTISGLKTIGQQLIMNRGENSTRQRPPVDPSEHDNLSGFKCPAGRVPLRRENSNEPVFCIARPDQNAPGLDECGESREFTCTFPSATAQKGVCCQRPPNSQLKCPLQMRTIVDNDGMVSLVETRFNVISGSAVFSCKDWSVSKCWFDLCVWRKPGRSPLLWASTATLGIRWEGRCKNKHCVCGCSILEITCMS